MWCIDVHKIYLRFAFLKRSRYELNRSDFSHGTLDPLDIYMSQIVVISIPRDSRYLIM